MQDLPCECALAARPGPDAIGGPVPKWQQPPTVRVRFSDPEEFAAELRERDPDVERLVRLTCRWRRDPEGLPCRHLSVVAGYLRTGRHDELVLCELVHYAGAVWDGLNEEESARTRERARRAREIVARAAEEEFLTVAAGAYVTRGDGDERPAPGIRPAAGDLPDRDIAA